jgi:quercetin dioxygenase-like cupin family protein
VTVIDDQGVSRVARTDEVLEVDYASSFPGAGPADVGPEGLMQIWRLWGHDDLPQQLPTDGLAPSIQGDPTPEEADVALRRSTLPPPSGMRVTMVRINPVEHPPEHHSGHDTFDIVFVIEGRIRQLLEGGEELVLTPGDCIIQCGTSRRYEALDGRPALIGAVVLGAERVGPPRPQSGQVRAAVSFTNQAVD